MFLIFPTKNALYALKTIAILFSRELRLFIKIFCKNRPSLSKQTNKCGMERAKSVWKGGGLAHHPLPFHPLHTFLARDQKIDGQNNTNQNGCVCLLSFLSQTPPSPLVALLGQFGERRGQSEGGWRSWRWWPLTSFSRLSSRLLPLFVQTFARRRQRASQRDDNNTEEEEGKKMAMMMKNVGGGGGRMLRERRWSPQFVCSFSDCLGRHLCV